MKKLFWYAGIIIAAVLGTFSGSHFVASHKSAVSANADPPACVASADVQCPTPEFLAQIAQYKALQNDILTIQKTPQFLELQSKTDQLTGMGQRLGNLVPRGFAWNEAKSQFDRIPVPAPAPTAPHPSPK